MKSNESELFKAVRNGTIVPERSRENWNPDERRELRKLYGQGMGISRIALHLQRSEMAIIQQLIGMELFISHRTIRNRTAKEPRCLCQKCEIQKTCTHQNIIQEDCYARV